MHGTIDNNTTPKQATSSGLMDRFGRRIDYVRLSVTDRCDFRCRYCMAEEMTFLPRKDVLSLEEILQISDAFTQRGVRRIRISGGEPLVRKDIMWLFQQLGKRVFEGNLDEVTLTTNGSQLEKMASDLYSAGVRRVNISLDTLKADNFHFITRRGKLDQVLRGIKAAKHAGLKVKINTVALRDLNASEIPDIVQWSMDNSLDLTLIETMPLGDTGDDRIDHYIPLPTIFAQLQERFALTESAFKTGGPARYFDIAGSASKLGLITPLTSNFCESCNRVRITCTGQIYMCLGQEDHLDLRSAIRSDKSGEALNQIFDQAMSLKPEGHNFEISEGAGTSISRHMSTTGG